jgi:hypothetical protein
MNQTGSYVVAVSSAPLYTVEMMLADNGFITSVPPALAPPLYTADAAATAPFIKVVGSGDVVSQTSVNVAVDPNVQPTFMIGNQVLTSPGAIAPGIAIFTVNLPSLDPGYVQLRARLNGVDSEPVLLHVLPADGTATQPVSGIALYQKIDVTDSGLDLKNTVMVPVRNARVEVFDPNSQAVVSVSETDERGAFTVAVPALPNLTIRVLSRIRWYDLRVADNTSQGVLYPISVTGIDGRAPGSGLVLIDKTRFSGAFNILDVVQRANDLVKMADPTLPPTPVTIFWSARNTKLGFGNAAQGLIGTSEFSVSTGTAYILGDRNTDSDEFDDAVIAHEYAHMLAAKYSRDDSQGGPHSMDDMLDPRLAWSEGWANFFSSAVRNDAIWRDSYGPNGAQVLRYDLGDNTLAQGPNSGYWSEASVDTLLWSLYAGLDNDSVQYPFSTIWNAFTLLKNDRFVYLPYFLDHFVSINNNPAATNDIVSLAQSRQVYYQPGAGVTNPFPVPVTPGTTIGPDSIDSFTTKRTNLVTSSHFYTFTTTGGATTVRMDITNLGPGKNPNANDLDIFLYSADGQLIDKSDTGGNGQPERIAHRLGQGTYVVEVRSFYTNGETGAPVYNSGDYTLSVSVQ